MVYKINYFIISIICLISFQTSSAQEREMKYREGWIVGFQLNEFGQNFGLGLHTVTPKWGGIAYAQVSYDYMYQSSIGLAGEDWKSYQQIRLSIITKVPVIKGKIDVYGGGGLIVGVLPSSISSKNLAFSGSGTFGVNLYWYEGFSYFFEMGSTGGLGNADNLPGKPVLGGGFYTSTGFRVHFK